MDVDQAHFRKKLLSILKNIADATFVTFDLEMSGISTRNTAGANRSLDVGKPSLQQQYEEMKSAAEKYQVLQIGITCVEEDREREYYLARPYNFYLSPISAEGVDLRLDRTFSFSSSACDFLSKNNFDFGKVFTEGVPYLSRDEEESVCEEFHNRAEKSAKIPDIVFAQNDQATLDFYRDARKTIGGWVNEIKPENDFVNVGNDEGPLNGFQRRLIHQLVRNEFPGLRTFARGDGYFMQITKLDQKREAEFEARKLTGFNNRVAKQIGLRWIFEALAGGDLSGIDPEWFADKTGEKPDEQLPAVKTELAKIIETLQEKNHVIVGHNLFTDLGFLYKTFVGNLPNNVKHFQEDIHEMFPIVIDTKYLATYSADSMTARLNLKDLLRPFQKTHIPLILLDEKHIAYGSSFGKEHEAGFDSWMTAELFVKLTAKLDAASKAQSDSGSPTPVTTDQADSSADESDSESSDSGSGGARLNPPSPAKSTTKPPRTDPPAAWHAMQLNKNPYEVLNYEHDEEAAAAAKQPKPQQWIPPMDDEFWDEFVNKLRVTGVVGGVCDLEEGSTGAF